MGHITEDLRFTGSITMSNLTVSGSTLTNTALSAGAEIARSKLALDALKPYTIALTDLRVHDAVATVLPGTPAADDLGLDSGTLSSEHIHVTAGDLKAAGATTRYARFITCLPAEYADAETVNIRISAGMLTTVADVSATVDLEAYIADRDTTVSADLVTTAATTCNSLTFANLDYVLTATSLVAGTWLDCRVAVAVNDAASATVVEAAIGDIQLLCDVRG